MEQYRCSLSIAGVPIRMELAEPVPMTPAFRPFLSEEPPEYTGRFRMVQTLPVFDERVLYSGNCYHVHPGGVRSFFDAPRDMTPYAVARTDHEGGLVDIACLEKGGHCISQMDNSFFHLGFEGLLIRRDRICFHASLVRTEYGGILFSGPSGIGKSTQADLWCRLRGAKLLNGDRPILQRREGDFLAWGSPYAGSSACYVNESAPVCSVVFLGQGPDNRIRRLKVGEAFRRIYAGLTMYSWDREFVDRACSLAETLAGTVQCYELICVPEASAVDCLEQRLKEDRP